jgi:hypothetical protein
MPPLFLPHNSAVADSWAVAELPSRGDVNMGPIKGPFFEQARFLRNFFEAREMNVPQASMLLWPMTTDRLYDLSSGRRKMDGWEVSHFYKKTGLLVPARYLRGEDKYGRPKKDREPDQKKFDELLAEANREW